MITYRYRLTPRGAFHFGERGVGLEETADLLHADTLFSALAAAWRALGEAPAPPDNALPSLRPYAGGEPPLLLSSALPYAGPVQLFPRPALPIGAQKALKQVAFVSAGALAAICQGQLLDADRAERELIQGGRVWARPFEIAQIVDAIAAGAATPALARQLRAEVAADPSRLRLWWGSADPPAPHVALDRITARSEIYYTGRLQHAHGCGLAFWAGTADDAARDGLEAALAFLQDEGLGGKRSSGHGQFSWEREPAQLPATTTPNAQLTLSLYHPTAAELAGGVLRRGWYQRILRRGWIGSPASGSLRRRGIWMLREGAVLTDPVRGSLEDLAPTALPPGITLGHPVYRYGFAFCLPLRIETLPVREEVQP